MAYGVNTVLLWAVEEACLPDSVGDISLHALTPSRAHCIISSLQNLTSWFLCFATGSCSIFSPSTNLRLPLWHFLYPMFSLDSPCFLRFWIHFILWFSLLLRVFPIRLPMIYILHGNIEARLTNSWVMVWRVESGIGR